VSRKEDPFEMKPTSFVVGGVRDLTIARSHPFPRPRPHPHGPNDAHPQRRRRRRRRRRAMALRVVAEAAERRQMPYDGRHTHGESIELAPPALMEGRRSGLPKRPILLLLLLYLELDSHSSCVLCNVQTNSRWSCLAMPVT